eukprot:CAMPEP_0119276734 /NCGR_PEP_ID=MMETSP1329-20130426/15848_1 /TAXON_ID=114041 /ORGANISM="Genus nov. species nov., Strain RCC1024" /LENGTH=63 /DNA_ID=CAMNT_0007277171 /DNA_START=26 /DNA_END=213 /DNA_ORIENTATION=+
MAAHAQLPMAGVPVVTPEVAHKEALPNCDAFDMGDAAYDAGSEGNSRVVTDNSSTDSGSRGPR